MPNEATLLQHIAGRDYEAFSELYDAYSGLVYSMAIRILRSPQEAEAVVQQVFMTIWQKPAAYDPGKAKFTTWLVRVTRNASIDQLRKQKRTESKEDTANYDLSSVVVETEVKNPLNGLITDEKRRRIAEALSQIPENQKLAIYLNFYDGLSHRQIATALDEPLGTVKTRIQLGLDKLRSALQVYSANE